MLKQILLVAVTAVAATLLTLRLSPQDSGPAQSAIDQLAAHISAHETGSSEDSTTGFMVTDELGEDAWLRGKSRDGSPRPGPADDAKPLADASSSICFLTKVEFTGLGDDEDTVSCKITIDDFTGWWQVHAVQVDETDASVACNARCLVWE